MEPSKQNEHFKPEWLTPPPAPDSDIHLAGYPTAGLDQPDLNSHEPDFIRKQIRQNLSHLLEQHDAIEVAYWALESFYINADEKRYNVNQYKQHADQLYALGTLAPDASREMALKLACDCLKDDFPGLTNEQADDLVDKMIQNWLEGKFCGDPVAMERIRTEIYDMKKRVQSFGDQDGENVNYGFQELAKRLFEASVGRAAPFGSAEDEIEGF